MADTVLTSKRQFLSNSVSGSCLFSVLTKNWKMNSTSSLINQPLIWSKAFKNSENGFNALSKFSNISGF